MTDQWNRRDLLGAAGAAAAALAVPRAASAQNRPNVLFILADDLGYGDLSCFGRREYETPVLDRLADEGMKLTNTYSAGAVCTPTRCAFITGQYPQRFDVGLQEPLTASSPPVGLPAGQPTIASRMRGAGYETALIGKWHLGWRPEYHPNRHGFDEFYGSLSGALDYFTHVAPDSGETAPDLWENDRRVTSDRYLTDLFTDRAVELVSRPREKPFYLSLHYTAPHAPWEGPADRASVDHSDHGAGAMVNGGSLEIYAAMMRSMDEGIGRVLAALRRARLERDTLVIFTSDNGGERYSFNWPFSFGKATLYEGGIRVPAIVRWPGVVRAGSVNEQAAITMDWTATILAAAGVQADAAQPLDGDNLLPVLTGERAVYERELFWRTRTRAAARLGRWKYVQDGNAEHLYDLRVDPGEKTDLKARQAAAFDETKRRYTAWASAMLPRPT